MGSKTLIVVPKGNVDNQGLGILEVLWKVMEAIIDTRIKTAVTFHDFLQGFCAGRERGAVIMELNIAQELESVDQDLPFLVLFDLWKAYKNLDRGHLLQTLERYGVVPKKRGILAEFWAVQEVSTSKNCCHGPQFRSTCGTTQEGLTSRTLINVAFYSVVQDCLYKTVVDDVVIHDGLVHSVGLSLRTFYRGIGCSFDILSGLYPLLSHHASASAVMSRPWLHEKRLSRAIH